ncbi:MAG: M1 family metallopeptidase [Deltaproteobacteria bacterium]|nr:M1 family metallopeptidase [Deltaproteobacteria bacterium]MDQ3295312.1 M1 family metallopeptidase [Myxococcota bacterium]
MKSSSFVVLAVVLSCGPPKAAPVIGTVPVVPITTAPASEPSDSLVPLQPTLRLPRNFLPTGYIARLAIDPAQDGFTGAIEIAGTLAERSSVIWLHGYHLTIAKAVARAGGREIALAVTPKGEDLLEIRAAQPLDPGAWTLAFDYTGELDRVNTTGAFKQTVADRTYVYTQLEAVYARRVFPCFDEPDSKVPWQLTLDIPKPLVAASNTPVTSERVLDDRTKRVEFAVTRPLPSYLVAFGIGPFEIVDAGKTRRGMPVRILTLAKRAAEAGYAAQITARLVDLTEDWFATPYPYEKLDIMTIPLTVGFGAMENAGLITFSEALMLLDPQKASKERKRIYAVVAAHEIAHQWFGNLVTPRFWDDIWLNEGFATWLAGKTVARFEPAWRMDEGVLEGRNNALVNDALVSARQIRQPIAVADDVLNAFDSITYSKGAAVLTMFERYLGPEVFQRGVREYLAARAWGNATSADFVSAIGKAAGKPIDAAFASFLEQAGAPEIAVAATCSGGKAELAISQRRYVPPGAPVPSATMPWLVPMCIAYEKAGTRAETCLLLDRAAATVALDGKACPRWVMPNVAGGGYYRNTYTIAQVTALRDEAWPSLSWIERRAVFFDLSAAALLGKLPLALALSFVPKLLAGSDRFTVALALELPGQLETVVPDALRPKFEQWLRQQFGPAATAIGVTPKNTDTLDNESIREDLVSLVGWAGREPGLVAEAVKLAEHWRDLPQSTRGLVLAIAVDASPALFAKILADVGSERDRTRRSEMYKALGQVRDVGRKQAALALVTDTRHDIRESMFVMRTSGSEATLAASQQYFRTHQAAIVARIPKTQTSGLAGLAWMFAATCKADQRDAMADYMMKAFGTVPGGARVVRQAIEGMDHCIAKRRLLEPEVRAWLGGVRIPKPKP